MMLFTDTGFYSAYMRQNHKSVSPLWWKVLISYWSVR